MSVTVALHLRFHLMFPFKRLQNVCLGSGRDAQFGSCVFSLKGTISRNEIKYPGLCFHKFIII